MCTCTGLLALAEVLTRRGWPVTVMLTGPAHHLCASIVLISAAAVLHHMIVPMVPRRPGLCTPTAPEDLITLRRPGIPCPATLPSDRQLDRRPNGEWHGGMLCPRRWAKSASLLANAVLGALQQYCETTCGSMLHVMRPLCTAYHWSTSLDLASLS